MSMMVQSTGNTPVAMATSMTAMTGSGSSSSTQTTSSKPTQPDYMKLIIAQMQNVNPMDSSSGSDSLPLMMQAEQLNQISSLSTSITGLQSMMQTSYASSLIGRSVSGLDDQNHTVTGTVSGVQINSDGPSLTLSNGQSLKILKLATVAPA